MAGVSGSGKTTLARRIAAITGGPHTEIDALFHGPQWTPRPEFIGDVHDLMCSDAWTTEWQYSAARPVLVRNAEVLVWLDLPFVRVTFPRLVRRTWRRRRTQESLWNGNVEPPFRTFFTERSYILRWAISTRGKYGREVPPLEGRHPQLVVVRLRTQREVESWIAGPLTESMAKNSG